MVLSCLNCNRARKRVALAQYTHYQKEKKFYQTYKHKLPCSASRLDEDIYFLLRKEGIVGGPSIALHGYHSTEFQYEENGVTKTQKATRIQHTVETSPRNYVIDQEQKKVKYITSNDENALYSKAFMGDMPCGGPEIIEDTKENIIKRVLSGELFGFVKMFNACHR